MKGRYPVAITDENEMMDILENSLCSTLADVKFNIADREKMDNDDLALVRQFPRLWQERNEWDEGNDYWVYSHGDLSGCSQFSIHQPTGSMVPRRIILSASSAICMSVS